MIEVPSYLVYTSVATHVAAVVLVLYLNVLLRRASDAQPRVLTPEDERDITHG